MSARGTMQHCCLAFAMASGLSGAATAQSLPGVENAVIEGQQINDVVDRATQRRDGALAAPITEIDGEAGVYVLRLNEIFQIAAAGGLGYTDNPQRTADNPGDSFYGDFAVSAGVATRLQDQLDVSLSASVGGREYFEDFGPSNRSASGTASIGTRIGNSPVYLSVIGFGGFNFDERFKQGISFYGFSGSVSASFPITPRLVVRPGIGLTRQWSGRSENTSASANASVDVFYALTPRLTSSLQIGVTHRRYDNFFEDVTFVERRDTRYAASASLAWTPMPQVSFIASAGYERQKSRFFLADYDALDTAATIAVRFRF